MTLAYSWNLMPRRSSDSQEECPEKYIQIHTYKYHTYKYIHTNIIHTNTYIQISIFITYRTTKPKISKKKTFLNTKLVKKKHFIAKILIYNKWYNLNCTNSEKI